MRELERVSLNTPALSAEEIEAQIGRLDAYLLIIVMFGVGGVSCLGVGFLDTDLWAMLSGLLTSLISGLFFVKVNLKWDRLENQLEELEKRSYWVELVKGEGKVKLRLMNRQELIEEKAFNSDSPEGIEEAVGYREQLLDKATEYNAKLPDRPVEDELFELLKG